MSEPSKYGHVLVVDDSAAMRGLIHLAFEALARPPSVAMLSTPWLVTSYLRREAMTDLVLLDYRMPGRNGLEILGDIRADASLAHVPVVLFSSSLVEELESAALTAGAAEVRRKPDDLSELIGIIAELCRTYLPGPRPMSDLQLMGWLLARDALTHPYVPSS